MTTANSYSIANIEAEYELSGALFRLEGLFDFGYPMPMDTIRYFWGAGLGYGSFNGDLEDMSLASASLASTSSFDVYVPYFVLGMAFSDISLKLLMTPYVHIRETEGVAEGDEKYGIGGGIEMGYKVFEYLSLNVGYHLYMCDRGKNNSTGLSGTLANDVTLRFLTVGLSVPFTFNSVASTPDRSFRRGRGGIR